MIQVLTGEPRGLFQFLDFLGLAATQGDAFTKLGALDGYGLAAKRIAFPGKINPSTDKCIVSWRDGVHTKSKTGSKT